jgi:PAS domain-containing protein
MDLDALFNNLLSSGIETTDPGAIKKVKVLNTFHLVFIMMVPLLGLFYFYIGAIFLFYVFIIAGVLMISSLILLRKTLNITVAGNCAILILWATLLIMTWYTGPLTSQGVIKPPLMMNGVYLSLIQYPFPNLIPAEISEMYTLGTYLFALLILFVFAFLYEKGKMETSTQGRKKPQTLEESKSYLDGVLEGFPIPTFILNRNHRVTQWNDACRQLTGHRRYYFGRSKFSGREIQGFHQIHFRQGMV